MLKLAVLCNFHSTSPKHRLPIGLPWQRVKSKVIKICICRCPIRKYLTSESFIFLLQTVCFSVGIGLRGKIQTNGWKNFADNY